MSTSLNLGGRERRGWWIVAAILATPALLLGSWAALSGLPDPTETGQAVEPLVAPVVSTESSESAAVTATIKLADGLSVSSAATGTVTLAPATGTLLESATTALEIDDRPVMAMVSDAPLWRELRAGDVGADVLRLQDFLKAAGYLSEPMEEGFGAQTTAAVTAFNLDVGQPPGATAFDPATVVWIGPEPLRVARVHVVVGDTLSPGTPVFSGPARPDHVAVDEPEEGLPSLGVTANLTVGDVSVPYRPGSKKVTEPDDVKAVAGALQSNGKGIGQVTAAEVLLVKVIPASAVVTGADGSTCAYASPDAEPVKIIPIGGGASSVQVDDSFELDKVLANPGLVALENPCGS